jgi:tRNA A-37 threonylcarbamoyl transferase component Bud32
LYSSSPLAAVKPPIRHFFCLRPGGGGQNPHGMSAGEGLDWLLTLEPRRPLRRGPGRVTFLWRRPDGGVVIVKRARGRGGRREFESLRRLGAAGLPVPRALAVHGGAGRSLVVMERVPHVETARERLGRVGPAEQRRLSEVLGEIVVALHELGWSHRDLYLEHFLMAEDDRDVVLIDLGRARRRLRRRWYEKDLAALLHSAPASASRALRLRFLAAYLSARGVTGRGERRRWAAAVAARRDAMARHVPRGGESPSPAVVEEGP